MSFAKPEKDNFNHQEVMPDVPPPEDFSPEKMAGVTLLKDAQEFVKQFFESDWPFRRRPWKCARWSSSAISARPDPE